MLVEDYLKNWLERSPWPHADQSRTVEFVCKQITDCVDPGVRIAPARGKLVENAICQVVIQHTETNKVNFVAILSIVGDINSFR